MTAVIPPPYVIDPNDKRGVVVLVAGVNLSFVWTCVLILIWQRWKLREWKLDDYFVVAASTLNTVVAGIVFHVVDEGLGRSQESLSKSSLKKIGKDDFGLQILWVLTLLLSKYAVLFLYQRLSPRKGHTVASWTIIGLSTTWAMVAIALIAAPCTAKQIWPEGLENCQSVNGRWIAITTLDVITEVLIFSMSIYLVARLSLNRKSKILVVAAFSVRLPVIASSIARHVYLLRAVSSHNRTLYASYYIVCTLAHVGYAVMSSTLAGLGPFLRPFTQSSKGYVRSTSKPTSGIDKSKPDTQTETMPGESYQMSPTAVQNGRKQRPKSLFSIGSSNDQASSQRKPNNEKSLNLRPDKRDLVTRNTVVQGGSTKTSLEQDDRGSKTSDDDSQHMMIKKKTEFTVRTNRTNGTNRTVYLERGSAVR